jgi:hypothetical protein
MKIGEIALGAVFIAIAVYMSLGSSIVFAIEWVRDNLPNWF